VTGLLGASQVGVHAALSALDPAAAGGHGAARPVPAELGALAAVGLVVARGEAALWDLCAWLAPLAPALLLALLLVLAGRPSPTRRVRPTTGRPDRPRLRRELARQHRRRGPPHLLAA